LQDLLGIGGVSSSTTGILFPGISVLMCSSHVSLLTSFLVIGLYCVLQLLSFGALMLLSEKFLALAISNLSVLFRCNVDRKHRYSYGSSVHWIISITEWHPRNRLPSSWTR
jgi:hypothetical protein